MTLDSIKPRFTDLYINGQWTPAGSGKRMTDISPVNAEPFCEVAEGDAGDIDRAVQAATAALEGDWAKMTGGQRAKILWKMADELEARTDHIAALETADNGKPIFESKIDIRMTVDIYRYFAGWADKITGQTIPVNWPAFVYTRREPVGVVGAIVPWNFPINLASYKVAPALACGCTVVLKPAEQTPLTALELADMGEKAGLPPGVLNVVPGYGPTAGRALVDHPGVHKISFTGSTDVGREIGQRAAATFKRVTLELGGKSPNVVFEDADLEAAIRGALNGIFYGKGEVCAAGSRLLVHRSLHDAMIEGMAGKAARFAPGDPFNPKTRMGAIVSEAQLNRVLKYIESAKTQKAELVTGGKRAPGLPGYYVEPTIFDKVTPDMTIAQEEIFGPVLSVLTFDDEDEAAHIANQTNFGLAAAIWTRDIGKAHRFASRVKAGTVWINTINLYDAAAPFGGFKHSGHGRDLGQSAIEQFTEVKTVWVG